MRSLFDRVSRLRTRVNGWDILFIGFVTLAMLSALFDEPALGGLRLAGFLAAGLVYCLLYLQFSRSIPVTPWTSVFYFSLQALLALAIVFLGEGRGVVGLAAAPMASEAAAHLPARRARAYAAALVLVVALAYFLLGVRDWSELLGIVAVHAAVIGMNLLAYQMNLRQLRARIEAERLNQDLSEANQKLRELANQSAELAAAQERNRIAREIHDSLGHHLTTLGIQLDVAEQLVDQDPQRAGDLIRKARSLARQGLGDVRQSVAALRSGQVPGDALPAAVQALAGDAAQTGLAVKFSLSGEPYPLSYPTRLTLYRAAQEALTNIHKHARASQAEICLAYEPARVRLVVVNDGPPAGEGTPGYGLAGLRERVELLAGTLEPHPRPEGGFYLCVEVPANVQHTASADPGPDRG